MCSPLPLQSIRIRNCAFSISQYRKHVVPSQFRLKVTCHPFSWLPDGRAKLLKAARFNNLRDVILNASLVNLNEEITSGTQKKDKSLRQLHADAILVVVEGICIAVASIFCLASLIVHRSQDSRLVSLSVLKLVIPQKADLQVWQTIFLVAALIINSVLRARRRPRMDNATRSTNELAILDPNLEGRVQQLEENVANAVTILRVLSKQLEKLTTRFRVTRQTLQDPIQETAVLVQKTSESVSILAAREDVLEKNVEEMHHVLLRMQENQSKQLELISTLAKLVKERPVGKVEKKNKTASSISLQHVGQERVDKASGNLLQNELYNK